MVREVPLSGPSPDLSDQRPGQGAQSSQLKIEKLQSWGLSAVLVS
jgi:hypothetical protein